MEPLYKNVTKTTQLFHEGENFVFFFKETTIAEPLCCVTTNKAFMTKAHNKGMLVP